MGQAKYDNWIMGVGVINNMMDNSFTAGIDWKLNS